MGIVEEKSDVGRFRNFADEANCIVDHSLNCIKENLRRASKESITITKPRENKRENESFGGLKKIKIKILLDYTDPPDPQVSKLTEFLYLFFNASWLSKIAQRLRAALENYGMSL